MYFLFLQHTHSLHSHAQYKLYVGGIFYSFTFSGSAARFFVYHSIFILLLCLPLLHTHTHHAYAHTKSGDKITKNIWNIQVFFGNNQIYLIFAMRTPIFRTNVRCNFGGNPPRRGRGVPKLQIFFLI